MEMKQIRIKESKSVCGGRLAAVALGALLLAAATRAAAQHAEDRPLPPSPCPDVFTYEGATVDWDRWYGVVLVATDTPLTGLRLDVWLSRPALALRHNWDGNVTTLDNKRFTILNLYKRIEPGPPRSVRIVVKFDEKEEVPLVRAVELNGRRICSSRSDSQAYDEPQRQPSRHRPEYAPDEELPLSHSAPSNSKYNFDRTTQRTTHQQAYGSYDSSNQGYKNTVSKRPPSNVADSEYERTTTRRPAYSDDSKFTYESEDDEYQARPPPRQDPTKRPTYHADADPDAHSWQKARPPGHEPDRVPPGHRKPSGGGGGEQQCGRTLSVTPLITHGQNTSRGQWPWHAALYQVKGADLKYICGGTLVSSNYVVTAAHCVTRPTTGRAVDPDTIIVYLGKYHLHRWTNEEGVQQGKVAAIHVHPNYNTTDFRGDVALLELSTHLSYTQYVRHVCQWGIQESADLNNIVNTEGYVVGWGYDEYGELTEELRMGTMPIVSEQTCLRSYPEFYSRFSNERTFCAGYKNGTSACNGDSGGGLVVPRTRAGAKTWFLRGLVSVSVSRDDQRVCNTQHYVVFTDLAKYRDWIASHVR